MSRTPTSGTTAPKRSGRCVSIAPASIAEGNSGLRQILFSVTLSTASAHTVSVRWATSNGTALSGRDYNAASGTVTFAAGQRVRTVGVWVVGDRIVEADETFSVTISSPVRAVLSTTARRATGTIVNDDGLLRLAAFAALADTSSTTKK